MLLDRISGDAGEDADPFPAFASKQLMHGLVDRLAENVPQGDVDTAQRGAKYRAGEVRVAGDRLVVVIDTGRILTDEVLGEVVDGFIHDPVVRPQSGLAGANDSLVGMDLNQQATIHQVWSDFDDFHVLPPSVSHRAS